MNIKDLHIVESLKKMNVKDVIYPGILAFFIIMVAIIFFIATRFISQNINKVFSTEGSGSAHALDLARYTLIAKKLGLTIRTSSEDAGAETSMIPAPIALPKEAQTPATITPPILNKQALTIMIRNSTAKAGAASTLAKNLKDAGFSTPTTGNEKTSYAVTTIFVKKSKDDYAPLLLAEVRKRYGDAKTATTSESAPFDATIIIGGGK